MTVQNTIYITDKILYLKNKNKIYKEKIPKNIIKNGFIADSEGFIKYYEKFMNKYNINKSLLGGTIKIIVNPTLTKFEINYLKKLFAYFNYRKVLIDYTTKYYNLRNNNAYLNVEEDYCVLSYINEYKKNIDIFIKSDLFLNINNLLSYIKYRIGNKELYLIGDSNIYEEIFSTFENTFGNKTFIFSDEPTYLINRA